jgi:2-polyprenyl-3-methyl-5-hydroxy-6-metoxy-1,4-benzoquinol methylase/predicted O-methyltransferase YrrM
MTEERIPSNPVTPDTAGRLEAALEVMRGDVARQISQIGQAAAAADLTQLPRFSSRLADELSPERLEALQREIDALEPWLQGPFVLAGNLVIPGVWRNDQRWEWLGEHVPDLTGKRVLDVGSNAGYDPFMFKLRGAREVVACEPFEFIHQAQFLESIYATGVDFRQVGWQQLDPDVLGRFDFVHCHGVLYHEPDPMGMLLRLRSMLAPDGEMLFGSMLHAAPDSSEYLRFVPDAYAGDRTWWLVPGRLAMRWMLEVTGFNAHELILSEGPRGEFRTLNGYFLATPGEIAPELTSSLATPDADAPPQRFAPGHYYSPMYDSRELESRREAIWPSQPRATPDVDWREQAQCALADEVFASLETLDFDREEPRDPTVYWALNDQYPPLDAWVLAGMVEHLRPRTMIEVGSGFSSLVTARVNRERLDDSMRFVCIEPNPRQFLLDGVPGISELRTEPIQGTPLETFDALGEGDILFIDTSHTVKTGGDVVWIFHEILPRLAAGVHVHIHDVFLPGEYPEAWVREGWGWNESYLVRSFLSYNGAFEVVWGSQYMSLFHPDKLTAAFPEHPRYADRAGAALWLRRRPS